MTGTFEDFRLTFHSFGQQYSTIDGQTYITWFNFLDPKLKGLLPGVRVEYETQPGPTTLCHSPHVTEDIPSARLLRVIAEN